MYTSRLHRSVLVIALGIMLGLLAPLGASARVLPDDDPGSPVRLSEIALASALFDGVFNGKDAAVAEALLSDDAVIHTPYGDYTGSDGLLAYLGMLDRGYPGASFDVSSIVVGRDSVVVRWTLTATQYQVGPNEPAIDVLVRMHGETTITVADGHIAGLTQTQDGVANTIPQPAAYEPLPGRPY